MSDGEFSLGYEDLCTVAAEVDSGCSGLCRGVDKFMSIR